MGQMLHVKEWGEGTETLSSHQNSIKSWHIVESNALPDIENQNATEYKV
jgi:hypothetical protein